MADTLPAADAALRGALIAMLLLFAALLLRERRHLPAARVGIVFALGLCLQAFSSAPAFEAQAPLAWQAPLVGVATANSVLFWLFACALFDDDFELRPLHAALWLAVAVASALNCWCQGWPAGSAAAAVSQVLRWLPLPFALLALAAAVAHWRADLVERRRRVRLFIVVAGSAYSLAQLAARLGSPQGRLSATLALLDMLALSALAAFVLWQVLRLAGGDLFPARVAAALPGAQTAAETADSAAPTAVADPDPAEQQLAANLQRLMAEDHAYRSEDLSISSLAARLQVPEYRLRRHINQRLGHRNFNSYINGWRLDEARAALADPARRSLPVLTIALTAGFQSIGPFNRAFKAATGRTPSEFRKENMAES